MNEIMEHSSQPLTSHTAFASALIVDDDAHDRSMLADILATFNPSLTARQFGNGLEVMQYLSYVPDNGLPEVIFLDLRMPIWDGIRTLKTLEADPRYAAIKVYIVSLADTPYETALCIRSGAQDFIVKPSTESQAAEFTDRIRKILEQTVATES